MLEPRKADLPVLFLFLVVLPLVLYFILGKWGEAAKKNERVSLLAQLAAEEALRAEAMTAASVTPSPVSSSSKNGFYQCARCFAPAKTRCSRCKSIRYCSGKCQITHWRQVHKDECQQMETSSSFSPKSAFEGLVLDDFLINEEDNSSSFQQIMLDRYSTDNTMNASISSSISDISSCPVNDASQVSVLPRKSTEKRLHRKSHKETLRREDKTKMIPPEETSRNRLAASSSSNTAIENESYSRQKTRSINGTVSVEEIPRQQNVNGMVFANGNTNSRNTMDDRQTKSQQENACETRRRSRSSSSSYSELETKDCIPETSSVLHGNIVNNETAETNNASEMATSTKGSAKSKGASHSKEQRVSRSPKTLMKISAEQSLYGVETIGQTAETSRVKESTPAQGSLGVSSKRIMNLMGLRKSPKLSTEDATESNKDRYKRVKVLFPYDVFVKFFQYEDFSISPRGLLNCGNSCYANAVLQCLTSTKPLVNYLLSRSHSRAGCMKDWCLMCQLEQHITMLREVGPPLSPSRVLSHIRSINFQIGDGSQEDAHEFLRFLVTSMQSLSLEGLGGESKIDPRLQETTFVQHTFGGRLRSKVKCLKCHHESERYENIMDLTLEIYGWVESLEDALTQFTTPEELDGENKYRCGRCGTYVRARKQLSIHEAPNILTIVLKRFQEGKYGKITKCITFPELLDMVPFMTGKDDIPPLYLLYAVVVHLDTLNASFSGHYVSYVKDVRGNWLRIDDTEVQPVSMSQVMSEGAYILFYSRSCPRPPRAFTGKEIQPQSQVLYKHCESKSKKSSQLGQSKARSHFVDPEASQYLTTGASANFSNPTTNGIHRSTNRHIHPMMDNTDATSSSDWSIFTSSDDASFTTESTRDSFSTVDYADACNIDAFSSIFNSLYGSEHSRTNTISCRSFPNSKPQTRFAMETKGYVLDSYLSGQPLYGEQIREEQEEMVGGDSNRYPCGRNCSMYVKYESILQEGYHHGYGRTYCHCNP